MRQGTFLKKAVIVVLLTTLTLPVIAAEQPKPAAEVQKPDSVIGDWLLTSDFNGMTMNSLLMIAKDKDGKLTGSMVGFMGMDQVTDLKVEDGKISFTQSIQFGMPGGGEAQSFTMNYSGTIQDGKMSLKSSTDQGEFTYEGKRLNAAPAAVGAWEFKRQLNGQEFISVLTVSQDAEGKFTADWANPTTSDMPTGQTEITNVKVENNKLTFTEMMRFGDAQLDSTYELTVAGDTLSGLTKSGRGDREVSGKRLGGDLIGKWELTVTSDMGERKQFMMVLPDLTGMFGATNVGKITFKDGQVGFKYQMGFGDMTFANEFKGQLKDGKLTGEVVSDNGTQKVEGKKLIPAAQ